MLCKLNKSHEIIVYIMRNIHKLHNLIKMLSQCAFQNKSISLQSFSPYKCISSTITDKQTIYVRLKTFFFRLSLECFPTLYCKTTTKSEKNAVNYIFKMAPKLWKINKLLKIKIFRSTFNNITHLIKVFSMKPGFCMHYMVV